MFKIVRKSTWDALNRKSADLEQENIILHGDVIRRDYAISSYKNKTEELKAENKRLFDYHNKRLQKTFTDKNGVKRNLDGTFARKQ